MIDGIDLTVDSIIGSYNIWKFLMLFFFHFKYCSGSILYQIPRVRWNKLPDIIVR